MDLSKSGHTKQEDADPAIMLFGKQIKNLSPKDGEILIKEQLSPRGVDEKGLSFATSSDEDEASEDAMHVKQSASTVMGSLLSSETARDHARKRKGIEIECVARDEKPKSNATESVAGDNHAGKLKGGIWSRCPRCNSADTKFCYFNNYNVNQPRHFCKHCQRYWTAGGTLRNVPIGAGKRKNKHALHKHNFVVANSTTALSTVPTASLSMGVPDADPISIVESDPLPTSESDPLSIEKSDSVNTNLELSAHQSFTDTPMPFLSPCNIVHPHSAHKLITLHQLHENLQSRLTQINHPHLATGCSKLGQIYPNLACGSCPLSPIPPELAGGSSKLSQLYPDLASGSSQISPFLPNGSYGSSHLRSGFPGLRGIYPGLQSGSSEFATLGPHLQTGSSRLYPHVQSGTCKTSQECLDCKRDELSGLGKSERGFDELKESELPNMSDQKNASLDRGLPDLARSALEKDNLGQIGMDPIEVDNYMQRLNQMKSIGASNECKVGGACNYKGLIEKKAPPMCLQGDGSQVSSRIKSEEAFNIESIMKRVVGEGHNNSMPIWGGLWPCFYNMFWLDPLAFSHFRPILTPQGWALPIIPPTTSSKIEPPHDVATPIENFDSSSTLTSSTSPPTSLLAPFKDVSNGACNIATTSHGKHYAKPTPTASFGNFEDVSDGSACNIASTSLRKC